MVTRRVDLKRKMLFVFYGSKTLQAAVSAVFGAQ